MKKVLITGGSGGIDFSGGAQASGSRRGAYLRGNRGAVKTPAIPLISEL